MNEKAFIFLKKQEDYVAQLARHVNTWLRGDPAVVGLNEIHPSIADKLDKECGEALLSADDRRGHRPIASRTPCYVIDASLGIIMDS